MPSITFGGLASGLDTNSIISALVAAESQPITNLQQQKTDAASRKAILGDLTTKLGTLDTAVQKLNTQSAVLGRAANVASGAPFTATVGGGAPLGSYNILVSNLAQAQRTYSRTFADPNATGGFSAGTLKVSIGANSASINVDGTDSLNTIANKLNSSGLRLNASVIYDGTNYRLVVNGLDTGAQNTITFSDPSATGLGLDDPANTVVAAKNAQLTVDGLAVTSSTNTVTGSIPGVTLTLTGTSATAYSMGVSEDPSQLTKSLQGIVDAYNAVMGVVSKQINTSGSSKDPSGNTTTQQLGPDTLVGDSSVQDLQATMLSLPTIQGGPAGNTFSSLVEIGVSVDQYGTMSLDQNALQSALAKDPAAVANLIAGTDGKNGVMTQIDSAINTYTDYVNGVLPVEQKSIDRQMSDMDDEISRLNTQVAAYQANLQQQFTAMEQMISSFQSQGSALSAQLGLSVAPPASNGSANTSGH